MKLSSAVLVALTAATSASATTIRSAAAKSSLLSKSRRLEENNEDEDQQDEQYQFLSSYKLKLIGCSAGEIYKNPENGEAEYSSVIYRLCPADDCDDDSDSGCNKGYGDFVVGINSFVESWLEDKRDDMDGGDDNWNMDEFAECRQWEADQDNDDEDGDNNQNQAAYYVGPMCGEEANEIKLGFFSDYTCTTVPEDVTFEDISNGWSLPYSDSGLVTNACESCAGYNDNGEYELSEMCMRLYENSGKCEAEMESVGNYGPDESGCEYIAELMPKSSSSAGAAVGWTIFAFVVIGAAAYGYTKWWTKKKQGTSGLATDGVMN